MNAKISVQCRALFFVVSSMFALLFGVTAHAGGLHLSASVGYLNTEQNGGDNEHGNFAGTATVGVEVLSLVLATIYAEFERTQLLDEGKWNGEDYSYSSDGAFLAVRTLGPLYAVGRLGFVKSEFDPELREAPGDRDKAVSLGLGYSVGLRNELLYTHVEHEGGGGTDIISFLIGF